VRDGLSHSNLPKTSVEPVFFRFQQSGVNPFYYGAFKFNGELYQGNHKPAIAKKLFDQVQAVMTEKSKPKKRGIKENQRVCFPGTA